MFRLYRTYRVILHKIEFLYQESVTWKDVVLTLKFIFVRILWHNKLCVLTGFSHAISVQAGHETVYRTFYVFIFHLQLLSQLDNHGPPPADRETIDNLPTVSVTAEHVGKFSLPSVFSLNIISSWYFWICNHVKSLKLNPKCGSVVNTLRACPLVLV